MCAVEAISVNDREAVLHPFSLSADFSQSCTSNNDYRLLHKIK